MRPSSANNKIPSWYWIGSGCHNHAYYNSQTNLVFKTPLPGSKSLPDKPTHAVAAWKEINPDLPAHQTFLQTPKGSQIKGWVAPYIKGKQATDKSTAYALINIYKKTQRIILDAHVPGNFLTTPSSNTICVDVGLAYKKNKPGFKKNNEEWLNQNVWQFVDNQFYPLTQKTMQALWYLDHQEDIPNKNLLLTFSALIAIQTLCTRGQLINATMVETLLHLDKEESLIVDTKEGALNIDSYQTIVENYNNRLTGESKNEVCSLPNVTDRQKQLENLQNKYSSSQNIIEMKIVLLIAYYFKKHSLKTFRDTAAACGAYHLILQLSHHHSAFNKGFKISEDLFRTSKWALAMKKKSGLRTMVEIFRKPLLLFGLFSACANTGRFGGYRTSGGEILTDLRETLCGPPKAPTQVK